MNSRKSQKEATTKELALGGGMMLVFLPVILFALITMAYVFIVLLPLTLFQLDSSFIQGVGLLSGILLVLIVVYLWKFWSRFRLLTGRWLGLRRENQRVAETIDSARLALDMTDAESVFLDDDDFDSIIITERSE